MLFNWLMILLTLFSDSGIIILYSASEQGYLVLALYKHALLKYRASYRIITISVNSFILLYGPVNVKRMNSTFLGIAVASDAVTRWHTICYQMVWYELYWVRNDLLPFLIYRSLCFGFHELCSMIVELRGYSIKRTFIVDLSYRSIDSLFSTICYIICLLSLTVSLWFGLYRSGLRYLLSNRV